MLTTEEADAAYRAVPFPKFDRNDPGRKDYHAQIAEIEAEWREWLEAEWASGLTKSLRDEIYRRAWDDGHSNGYCEVQGYYEDYANFAHFVLEVSW